MDRNEQLPLEIRSARTAEIIPALRWALRAVPAASRESQIDAMADDLRSGRVPLDSLVVACRQRRLVGAALAQVQPGRSASLWPPAIASSEPADTAGQLLSACLDRLASRSVRIAQVVLEKVLPADAALLESHGFRFLADLLYLGCLESQFPQTFPDGTLDFEPYSSTNHARLARIVEATYAETLDCPGLDNVRDVEDVLAGYHASGAFRPDFWLIIRNEGHDVGTLILADYPKHGNLELVYMGIVPAVRGHAWGKQIVRRAQWIARQIGRPRLVLAVDRTNRPAIDMYSACGFEPWDRRRVYLKVFA